MDEMTSIPSSPKRSWWCHPEVAAITLLVVGIHFSRLTALPVCGEDVLCHVPGARWPPDAQWLCPLEDPRGEDQIGVSRRVIRVQVREKGAAQFLHGQAFYACLVGGSRAPDDARPKVNQVGGVVDDDGDGWARAFRFGVWGARTQEDDVH